jgi:hypothetical protein
LGGWEVKALLGVLEVEVGEEVGVDSRWTKVVGIGE